MPSRYRVHALAGTLVATALYACSSDDNPSTPPPVNPPADDASALAEDGSVASDDAGGGRAGSGGADSAVTDGSGAPSDGGPPPACSSLPGTVVYIESGDTQEPLLKALGRKLRDNANITIAFQLTGSCTLSPNLYAGTPIPKNTNMLYIPSTAENPSWTTSNAELTCTTDREQWHRSEPRHLRALSEQLRQRRVAPAGIGSFIGPIQAYTFIVPTAEFGAQTAISAAEAYYALGDGANNPVTYNGSPEWNVPSQFFLRPTTKSTLVATSLNIGLTAAEATLAAPDGGTADGRNLEATSDEVLTAVETSTSMQALGILGDEIFDVNRGKGVNILAFQAFGQSLAYYPDSTTTSFDKQNIRDGHYTLWSPTVYIAPVDSGGAPSNPAVKYITDLVLGNPGATPPGGLTDGGSSIDGLGAIVSVGLTPNCAMQVQRAGDGAPLAPYAPTAPCTCASSARSRARARFRRAALPARRALPARPGVLQRLLRGPADAARTGAAGCDSSDGGYGEYRERLHQRHGGREDGRHAPRERRRPLPLNP